jgi:hypothetical protein
MGVCLAVGIPLIIWWIIKSRRNKREKTKQHNDSMAAKQQNDAVNTALEVARHKGKAERLDKFLELVGGGKEGAGAGAGSSRV